MCPPWASSRVGIRLHNVQEVANLLVESPNRPRKYTLRINLSTQKTHIILVQSEKGVQCFVEREPLAMKCLMADSAMDVLRSAFFG